VLNRIFNTFFNYKEDPKPEYAPKRKRPKTLKAARPPTVAIAQRGTRLLVSAIEII
jgi:hypothetical protein